VTIADALENLRICTEEFEAADHVCRQWSKVCGFTVWCEGHPLDRMKLRRRRRAKLDLKRARWYVNHALAGASAAGRG
jgi:hypothetical protein